MLCMTITAHISLRAPSNPKKPSNPPAIAGGDFSPLQKAPLWCSQKCRLSKNSTARAASDFRGMKVLSIDSRAFSFLSVEDFSSWAAL